MEHHGTAAAGLAGTNFLRLVEFYENIHLKLISEALLLLGSINNKYLGRSILYNYWGEIGKLEVWGKYVKSGKYSGQKD